MNAVGRLQGIYAREHGHAEPMTWKGGGDGLAPCLDQRGPLASYPSRECLTCIVQGVDLI